jgi:ceramide glucosyltransferase
MLALHVLQFLLLTAVIAGICYYAASLCAAASFFSSSADQEGNHFPPVSVLIPLCGQDFEAIDNFSSFCRQDYPDYQIVFGVRDSRDPMIAVVRELMVQFKQVDIQLVINADRIGQNLKVSNLQNILSRAKHGHIVIADSDVRVGPDYIRTVIAPLADPHVGLVTCLYRSTRASNLPSRLEAIGIAAEFIPSVLMSRALDGMRFALGASMATSLERLQSIGGFHSIADHLADDFMLGHLLSRAAYRIHLSRYVVEVSQPPVSFRTIIKHQVRLSRGIRACRPLGHLGLILTFGTVLSFFYSLASGGSAWSIRLLSVSLVLRMIMGWVVGVHWLRDGVLRANFWLLPLRDFFSFVVWVSSFNGREVEWRGQLFELIDGGRMVQVVRGRFRKDANSSTGSATD